MIYTSYVEITDKRTTTSTSGSDTAHLFRLYAFSSRGWKVIVLTIKMVDVSPLVITTLLTILITLGISAGPLFPPMSRTHWGEIWVLGGRDKFQ